MNAKVSISKFANLQTCQEKTSCACVLVIFKCLKLRYKKGWLFYSNGMKFASRDMRYCNPSYLEVSYEGMHQWLLVGLRRCRLRPSVILVHSFPLCRQMWQSQIEALSGQGIRVVAPDLRGFGESVYAGENFSLTALADDINALMSYLGIGWRAVMVGVSMAGGILLDILERYPERIAATCFLSPAMQPSDAAEQVRRYDLAELVREGHRPTAIDNLCERLVSGPPSECNRSLTSQLRGWMESPTDATLSGALASRPRRLSYRDESHYCPVPTLIMTGERDRVMPVPKQSCPENGLRQVVNGAGHLINLEAPLEVN
jgi:pimeloyl-ACP methyl ester carboxylesterase